MRMKKGFIPGAILILGAVVMVIFVMRVVLPAAEDNARVCTLEVEAVVVDNTSYYDEDRGLCYQQIVEYTVDGEVYRANIGGSAPDPVALGTGVSFYVDPDDPGRFTTTKDVRGVGIASMVIPLAIIVIVISGGIRARKK